MLKYRLKRKKDNVINVFYIFLNTYFLILLLKIIRINVILI